MSNFYVACDLGAEIGRVMMGTLHKGKLTMSEIRRFPNVPIEGKDSLVWNIPQLYQETLSGLREIGKYEEPVSAVSCNSWGADYLLFGSDGSLISPTHHHRDPRAVDGLETILAKVPWQIIYDETGVQQLPGNTLFQLGAEKSRRLRRASHLMPIADGFNYLLSGVPRVEMSSASTTQLYNPLARTWSDRLLEALRLPPDLFPTVVPAGTKLGMLRPEISRATGLGEARVIASCSHELAAELAGLPANKGEQWAYLRLGSWSVMGNQIARPLINDESRELNFSNETGFGGSMCFHKHTVGLWILEECRRFWKERDRELDVDVLAHLAACAEPFESLINPDDPRFLGPDNMPFKIQAFCKDTGQPVPRKPGSIIRCVLESLALHYRKTLREIEQLTGRETTRLFLLGDSSNSLLNHFTANALQVPIVIAPADATAIGNVLVQALALGHIESSDEAREIVKNSFNMETITPRAAVWNVAYDRLAELDPRETSLATA
jgi:rhamnulokinase